MLSLQDALVLATDGVTDRLATSSEPLGELGLVRHLTAAPPSPAHICDALLSMAPITITTRRSSSCRCPRASESRRRTGERYDALGF